MVDALENVPPDTVKTLPAVYPVPPPTSVALTPPRLVTVPVAVTPPAVVGADAVQVSPVSVVYPEP
jgi:hypothetical protein